MKQNLKSNKERLNNLLNLLASKNMPYHEFIAKFGDVEEIARIIDVREMGMWQALGLELEKSDAGEIELATRFRDISEQEFCVVDIETSGGTTSGQIIEIGAVRLRGSEQIGRFETFVSAPSVPENITQLTGISALDLVGAPPLSVALEKFKTFLGTAVFVAHNVNFDYGFISHSLSQIGLGVLLNRKICTIDLARRTIASQRYGLGSLKELLGITNAHHRALNDAVAAAEIFKFALTRLPFSVQTTEDLIAFSKNAPSMKINSVAPLNFTA